MKKRDVARIAAKAALLGLVAGSGGILPGCRIDLGGPGTHLQKSPTTHVCAGLNDCKGKGGCGGAKGGCKGGNDCKGKGNCRVGA